TPIARTRDRETLTPAVTSVRPIAIRSIGIATGRAAITALTTAASGRATSRPALPAAPLAALQPSLPPRSGAKPMPDRTGLSASPAPCSAARTDGGISASKAACESSFRKGGWKGRLFHARAVKAVLEVLALCGQV